ncbi:hypothetical protein CCHL11_10177 [Colletotrichum chlorophyti]|uniref:Uncharacterized protein n=1 Tax=Colletotrichum chlorophyti TaxID=708187 RepID=A0A1Q8RD87_9PEZI|nr:hypothetical protein CCHL11_10177 [Colletotrichum chlorophyti]
MSISPQSHIAPVTHAVNALLLRTFALLHTSHSDSTLRLALESADRALEIASHFRRFDLEPRAQLYRGHVLRAWGRWHAAHGAYVRAASVRGIGFAGTDIRGLTAECLEMIRIEKVRRSYEGKRKGKVVRFEDEDDARVFGVYRHDDDEGTRSDQSSGEMYLLLNEMGEVVGRRESLPDLRTVRGRRSVSRSPSPDDGQTLMS